MTRKGKLANQYHLKGCLTIPPEGSWIFNRMAGTASVFSPRQTDRSTETLDRKNGCVSVEEEVVVVIGGDDNTVVAQHQALFLAWLPHSSGLWRTQAGALPSCRSHFS